MNELFIETNAFRTDIKAWGGGAFSLIPSPDNVDPTSFWWGKGITFNDRDCAGAGSHNACETAPKCEPINTPVVKQSPFTVYSNLSCDVEQGLDASVLNSLLYKTPFVMSRELEFAPSRVPSGFDNPSIVSVSTSVSPTAYDLVTAVSNLVFNRDKNGIPFSYILLPSWLQPYWGDAPVSTDNYRLVFLPGYQGLEPGTGNDPNVGEAWITAVSNVEYLVTEPEVYSAFDQRENIFNFYAKRQGIIRFSVCDVYSILVGV